MNARILLCLVLALGPLAGARAQDLDELYRRMQAGDEQARREYWARKKGAMRDIFEQAYQGTLDETTPPAGPEPPGDPERPGGTTGPDAARTAELVDALKLAVVALFDAYEQESIGAFLELVSPSFAARDRNGTDYRQSDLPRVLSDDFAILERIGFTVQVEQPIVQSDGKRAQVDVVWSRRAWVQTGGQEWILLDQRSVFQFEADATGRFLLAAIFGDPIFAIALRKGEIVVSEGTIDGQVVTTPVTLTRENGIVVVEQPPQQQTPPQTPAATPPSATVVRRLEQFVNTVRFDFDTQTISPGCAALSGGDIAFNCDGFNIILTTNGAAIRRIGNQPVGAIETVATAPDPPYGSSETITNSPSDIGELYAIQTSDGRFALLQITDFSIDPFMNSVFTVVYKYQSNGSRSFLP